MIGAFTKDELRICVPLSLVAKHLSDCIGDQCMFWRWAKDDTEYIIRKATKKEWICDNCEGTGIVAGEYPEGDHCYECEGKGRGFEWEPCGYCGLAGKP